MGFGVDSVPDFVWVFGVGFGMGFGVGFGVAFGIGFGMGFGVGFGRGIWCGIRRGIWRGIWREIFVLGRQSCLYITSNVVEAEHDFPGSLWEQGIIEGMATYAKVPILAHEASYCLDVRAQMQACSFNCL